MDTDAHGFKNKAFIRVHPCASVAKKQLFLHFRRTVESLNGIPQIG